MIPKSGNRLSVKIMPTQKTLPAAFSAAELSSLFHDLEHFPALVLAVSGGPDSTALMLLAARWRDGLTRKPKLIAVTIDHGLRKEAKAEAAAVAKLARKLKVTHRTLRWTGKKPATGLQQAARAARYRLLAQAARRAGAPAILTAHTLDDQAETVLIRMSRGSGVSGLGAMQRVSAFPYPSPERGGSIARNAIGVGSSFFDVPPTRRASLADLPLSAGGKEEKGAAKRDLLLIRPLLDIPKSRLTACLKAAKISFAEDPSNRDPRFTRARLRALMPVLAAEGLDARRLALLARRVRRADAAIEDAVDRATAELAVTPSAPGATAFDAAGYARLPAEIGLRLIGRAITERGYEGPVELAKLEALKDALDAAQKAGTARFRRSLAGAIVTIAGPRIVVERAPPRRRGPLTTGRRGPARRVKPR